MKYLYNGIELPTLPEWDKTTYPYVNIFRNLQFSGRYYLEFTAEPVNTVTRWVGNGDTAYQTAGDVWEKANLSNSFTTVWANHDIYKEDGTLDLSASCPIDVETGKEIHDYCLHPVPQLNPSVLMQGFATMLSLRRNRT